MIDNGFQIVRLFAGTAGRCGATFPAELLMHSKFRPQTAEATGVGMPRTDALAWRKFHNFAKYLNFAKYFDFAKMFSKNRSSTTLTCCPNNLILR